MEMVTSGESQIQSFANWPMPHAKGVKMDKMGNEQMDGKMDNGQKSRISCRHNILDFSCVSASKFAFLPAIFIFVNNKKKTTETA